MKEIFYKRVLYNYAYMIHYYIQLLKMTTLFSKLATMIFQNVLLEII